MWTANGVVKSDHEVPLYIAELDEKCYPYILKNTPDVLTMGRRCMCDGYSFVWKAHPNRPYFRRPDGKRIFLTVDHYVPYLLTDLDVAAPVAGESEDESDDDGCGGEDPHEPCVYGRHRWGADPHEVYKLQSGGHIT